MKNYGGENFDRALYLSRASDGGYLLCGYSNSFNRSAIPNYDLYLVKTDSQGKKEWEKTYGGDKMDLGWSVRETKDGFLLHGCTRSRDSTNQDIIIIKVDKKGNSQWERVYGSKYDERTTDLIALSDGNYLLVGERIINDSLNRDSYLLKIGPDGNFLWEKTFGGPLVERTYYGAEVANGECIIAGSIMPKLNGKADLLLLKISSAGELIWTKTYGEDDKHEVAHSFSRNRDGRTFTIHGYISSVKAGFHDALFVQIDPDGNKLTQKSFQTGDDMRMMHGCETADAGFVVTGFVRNDIEKNLYDAILLRYDESGEVQWKRTFGTPGKDDQGYWVIADKDGGYSLAGYTHSFGVNGDLWLIRTDSKGNVQ